MKEIKLTQGKVALVDDEDYQWLSQWKWHMIKGNYTTYAARSVRNSSTDKINRIHMHRVVLKVTDSNLFVDHKDHNGLNNCKSNLRVCTAAQNKMNRVKSCVKTSKYLGVCKTGYTYKEKKYTYWSAFLSINGKIKGLGNFKSEEEAARAYDKAAVKYHKEFANVNFKTGF